MTFIFPWNGKIQVKEKESRYNGRMEDVKSGKDMNTDSTTYVLDTNGNLLSKKPPDFDTEGTKYMVTVFKKNVPMILKP